MMFHVSSSLAGPEGMATRGRVTPVLGSVPPKGWDQIRKVAPRESLG